MSSRKRLLSNVKGTGLSSSKALRNRRGTPDPLMEGKIFSTGRELALGVAGKLAKYSRPNMYREGNYTHVSDLVHKCARMMAIAKHTESNTVTETLRPGIMITFALGSAIGDFVVDSALKIYGPDEVYGGWSCLCGSESVVGTRVHANNHADCPKCSKPLTHYRELLLQDEEYRITGSVDLTLLQDNALYFVEVKSIAPNRWDDLTGPLPDHTIQVLFYWWLAHKLGYNVHKNVSVLYVTKAWTMRSPYKEYIIDAENSMNRLDDYLEDALRLAPFKRGESSLQSLPIRICPTLASPQAKKCPLASKCFSCGD